MAKAEKKSAKQLAKLKKKRWFPILSPKMLGEKQIGESYLTEAEFSIGRSVKANLMQVTGDVKSQSSELKFEIIASREGKLETKLYGYYFSTSTIKRLVRRNMTRIDDSLIISTA